MNRHTVSTDWEKLTQNCYGLARDWYGLSHIVIQPKLYIETHCLFFFFKFELRNERDKYQCGAQNYFIYSSIWIMRPTGCIIMVGDSMRLTVNDTWELLV